MSFAIIRNQNHKVNDVPLAERHNERRNQNYSNKDIDLSRSANNYHLKEPNGTYLDTFYAIREQEHLKGNLRQHRIYLRITARRNEKSPAMQSGIKGVLKLDCKAH